MAFGFRYWMVFLPEIEPESFLLFVHNPAGSTKLRSYATGRERVIGQPRLDLVFRNTEIGKTRHECDAHGTDDDSFWCQKTEELNRRYLMNGGSSQSRIRSQSPTRVQNTCAAAGRAVRGSRRQLQDYVNVHPDVLSNAILDQLPARLRELEARVRWTSPLAHDDYREYRDADFLERVRLADFAPRLAEFWPNMGPSWDALGVISDPCGRLKPGVILVEAKSHIAEIYGGGCKASRSSLLKIEEAFALTRSWCGTTGGDWLGQLYQYANRIAHLYFLFEQLRVPAWLVNVYFTGDPIGPVDRQTWERELASIKTQLGLQKPVPHMLDVYLPALDESDTP